jgi:2-oxoglutarate ferredoxin oxidoreductase subunit alpha
VRIAVKYRTPVIILSDGYLANGSEPWRVPEVDSLARLRDDFSFANTADWPAADKKTGASGFQPFQRDPQTLARPWAIPGTPGLEHRIGGIEKADGSGEISYDPDNHDRMVRLRQAKIDGIAADIGPLEVDDPDGDARVLVLGWGSTYGAIGAAVRLIRAAGSSVAQAHLRHLSPFPANLGDVLSSYDKVLVPEMNLGQLALLLRGRFLVDVISYNQVRGMPFRAAELADVIQDVITNV